MNCKRTEMVRGPDQSETTQLFVLRRSMKIMGGSGSGTDGKWLYSFCLKMHDPILILDDT